MMTNDKDYLIFCDLVYKALLGVINEQELAALEAQLRNDPKMRECYQDLLLIHIGLTHRSGVSVTELSPRKDSDPCDPYNSTFQQVVEKDLAESDIRRAMQSAIDDDPSVEPNRAAKSSMNRRGRVTRRQVIHNLATLAAMLMFAILIVWLDRQLWQRAADPPAVVPVVAQLVEVQNARWADTTLASRAGEFLRPGSRRLLSGLAKIEFKDGASVIVEGPCAFSLHDDDQIMIREGQVVAYVPRPAQGFKVVVPDATIMDIGTEFAVDVDVSGTSDVHVFDGLVVLSLDAVEESSGHLISEGQAMRVKQGGTNAVAIKNNVSRFTREIPSAFEQFAKSLHPYSYWRFGGASFSTVDFINPRTSKAHFTGQVSCVDDVFLTDGKPSSILTLTGPDSGSVVLEIPLIPQEGDHSYSLWVRPDGIEDATILGIQSSLQNDIFRFIGIDERGRIRQYSYSNEGIYPDSMRSEAIMKAGRWYHIVVTGQVGLQKKLYINGRLDATSEGTYGGGLKAFNLFYLGKMPDYGNATDAVSFAGAVSELIIFDRALSEVEVRQLYQSH